MVLLRHVSILRDHPQGVCLYLAKVTEIFKNFLEFLKFKTLNLKSRRSNSGVVAAIHVAGVRCEPCGAMRCIVMCGCV